MFAAGWIGGGDAKLFAGAGLWLGWQGAPMFLLATGLCGGALAVMLLNVRRAWLKPYLSGAPAWFARLAEPGAAVPYGVAIAIGALAAFPHSALVQSFHGSF
jgi:prepilin peptidase CpaA